MATTPPPDPGTTAAPTTTADPGTTAAPTTTAAAGAQPLAGPASCPANVRETLIAWGMSPQTDLVTPNTLPTLWSLTKTNTSLMTVTPNRETDAQDIGKGDEFPTQTFPTSIDVAVPVEKYCSSEMMAWLFCFTTGKATKSGAVGAGFTYAAVPSDPVVNCLNLPVFTYAELIRAEPNSVIDRAAVGMVVNDWTLTMESGPGRANCRVTTNWVGTGKVVTPSTYSPWPGVTAEHFLNAASATINICGIDYVLAQSFISLEFRWNNNVRLASGLFPGSGTLNGFAIRGRMEYGNREFGLTFVARAALGSPEYTALMAQPPTEGPVTITTKGAIIGTGPQTHGFTISIPRAVFTAVANGDADGIVTVNCTVTALKPVTGSIITMSAICERDGLMGL